MIGDSIFCFYAQIKWKLFDAQIKWKLCLISVAKVPGENKGLWNSNTSSRHGHVIGCAQMLRPSQIVYWLEGLKGL